MATTSRIVEESFRLGAGRYIHGEGVISLLGEECRRLGASKPIVIGGKTALSITRDAIDASLSGASCSPAYYIYSGVLSEEGIENIKKSLSGKSFDCVIGVGGGTVMDAAKYYAALSALPVINIPTSSSTCAAYTPLSVCYKPNGHKDRTVHHKKEVDAVLCDMNVLAKQPTRLFLAGAYDAMAKLYELRQRMLGVDPDECDIGLLSSYHTSEFMLGFLKDKLPLCIKDMEEGHSTKRLSDAVYVAIALCGVVSGLARGSNQTALAHKVYEIMRNDFTDAAKPYLHGELVALGLILQIAFNGEGDPCEFIRELRANRIPSSFGELGINEPTAEKLIYDRLLASTAMAGTTDEEKERLRAAIKYII